MTILKELTILSEMAKPKKAADIKAVKAAAEAGDVRDFLDVFDMKFNSAAGMWMDSRKAAQLMKLVADGNQVTNASVDVEDNPNYPKLFKANMEKKGWILFDEEHNFDSWECIFYKKK